MRFVLVLALASALLPSAPARAAGMKLERDRLANMDGPETAGQWKFRFEFQHNIQDLTLLPVADLTLAFGVWSTVQIQAEALLHNADVTVFGQRDQFQYDVTEYSVKWAILDQTKDDPFSLAATGAIGHTQQKYLVDPPPAAPFGTPPFGARWHENNLGAWGVATYDTPWVTPYLGVKYVDFQDSRQEAYIRHDYHVTTPQFGGRIKAYESKDLKLHAIGDFAPKTFDGFKYSMNAWGGGLQFMWGSPHIFTFFVSNTFGETMVDSIFGNRSTDPAKHRDPLLFYNFRWSYRF